MKVGWGVWGVLCSFSVICAGGPATLPSGSVPDSATQQSRRQIIRELYRQEYAGKDRATLAKALVKRAVELLDDPAGRYVLLDEARQAAISAGDPQTAFEAIDLMDRYYQVETVRLKTESLLALTARGVKDERISHCAMQVAEVIFRGEEYAKAGAVMSLVSGTDVRSEKVKEIWRLYLCSGPASRTLLSDANDAGANLAAGRFYCLAQGNWDRGLPHLAMGSDVVLARLAKMELANPSTTEAMRQLADGWWSHADGNVLRKQRMCARAAYWYRAAMPQLAGLERSLAEKRLEEERVVAVMTLPRAGMTRESASTTKPAMPWPKSLYPDAVPFAGRWYALVSTKLTWPEAKRRCEVMGGHLATITSPEENAFVTQLAKGNFAWLGAMRQAESTTWRWVTNEPLGYTNWAKRQPNGPHKRECCVQLWREGQWNDLAALAYFICEWEGGASCRD